MSKHVTQELERLAAQHGGILHPSIVVDAAQPETSPLHRYFEWDDSEAARRYRLVQAEQLIRVSVTLVHTDTPRMTRAFVSLRDDREQDGGYRPVEQVLQDDALRAMLLQDALRDIAAFTRKYKDLQELADVVATMQQVRVA